MKVLYDHQIFSWQKYGGISRYFFELMNYYYKNNGVKFDLSLIENVNEFIKHSSFWEEEIKQTATGLTSTALVKKMASYMVYNKYSKYIGSKLRHNSFSKVKRKIRSLANLKTNILNTPVDINMTNSIDILNYGDYDIFHPTYYDTYFLENLNGKPFVLTIYDMIHELFCEEFPIYNDNTIIAKKTLAERASRIIAISENTKKDIIKIYGTNPNKIDVVYLGNTLLSQEIHLSLKIPKNYILYVGDRWTYKNFKKCVEAIAPLLVSRKDLFMICGGGINFSNEEIAFIDSMGIKHKIIHMPVNDEILSYLYSKALVFIFPTRYEGFGIPILEAFAGKCPAAVSQVASLPEIAGDACVYFNPDEVESMSNAVKEIIDNEELRKNLIDMGTERLKEFSWEYTAEKTEKIYRSVVNSLS